jgi:predicted metalloendopeptidase
MWKQVTCSALCLVLFTACGKNGEEETAASAPLKSGIDPSLMDTTVRPQDDIYLYAAGTWEKETEIPADKPLYTTYMEVRDRMDEAVQSIVQEVAAREDLEPGSPEQQVADFYRAYMDEAAIAELGLSPLAGELERIRNISSNDELPELLARLYEIGVSIPLDFGIFGDSKNPTDNILYMVQSGLGMPDREYYLEDSERYRKLRAAYADYLAAMLGHLGQENREQRAAAILALETRLAEHQWTKVDSRNPDKHYNKRAISDLDKMAPGFAWPVFMEQARFDTSPELIVYQPSYMTGFAELAAGTELETWQDYLMTRLVMSTAPYLDEAIYATYFDFNGRTLNGTESPRPRWQRAIAQLNASLGESVGKVFIKTWFPAEAKTHMDELVENLVLAMDARLDTLDWMSAETRSAAHDKLEKMEPLIGYPGKWRDYSGLRVEADQLLSNIWASRRFEHRFETGKLGKKVDKELWYYPPQTVNASFVPTRNQIIFPAGYLQPPHFQLDAEDAVNYGSIGATIGHEIGHAFDDQGSKYDGDGQLRDWWTKEDREAFDDRTRKLVTQFNNFCPFEDACLNGELSLGENIGDLAGLIVAYDAYQLSLMGQPAPVIDGLSGDQRFILGFVQGGKGKWREEFIRSMILTDPHVPDKYRILGPLQNFDVFYEAFDVTEGDAMYLAPEDRVRIW